MSPTEGARTSEFWRTLFDFENKPGRYALILRQPRILFDSGRLLLQLCSGRVTSDMADLQIPEERARTAAKFFVKTAMLRQGVDHYTLLGLKPGFEESELKDNYRLLMRLTHPDFASQGDGWPEDAATRINRAYDVLFSESSRKPYESTLDMRAYTQGNGRTVETKGRRPWLRVLAVTLGCAGVLWLGIKWWRAPPAPVANTAVPAQSSGMAGSAAMTPEQVVAESVRRSLAGTPVLAQPVESPAPSPLTTASAPGGLATNDAARSLAVKDASSLGASNQAANSQGVVIASRGLSPAANTPAPAVAFVPPPPAAAIPHGRTVEPAPATRPLVATIPATPAPVARSEPVRSEVARVDASRREVAATAPPAPALAAKPAAATDTLGASQAAPKLADVQPYLSGLISSMLSGREASVLAMIDKPVQTTDGATRFLRHYVETVKGAEEIRMGSLQLKSHVETAHLVVEGAIHFVLLDANRTPMVRELRIRAYYGTQGGHTHLAALYPG